MAASCSTKDPEKTWTKCMVYVCHNSSACHICIMWVELGQSSLVCENVSCHWKQSLKVFMELCTLFFKASNLLTAVLLQ